MKNILTFAFLIFCVCITTAQQASTRPQDGRVNYITTNDRFQYINPYDDRYKELRGTRYFLDSIYRPGELQTSKFLYTTELLYRFDQTERTVQVKTESGKELWLNENDIIYFKLYFGEKAVHFVSAAVPNGRKSTLLQVIYKTPTMQLLRDSRKFIFRVKADNIDGYGSEEVYDEVRKDYRYFISIGEKQPFQEVKPTAKSFGKVLPSKQAQINRLFKQGQMKDGLNITKLAAILKELDTPKKVEN